MLRSIITVFFVFSFLSVSAHAFDMGSGSYNVTNAVLGSGGNISSSTGYRLDMTIGQVVINYSKSSGYTLYLGRTWALISSIFPPFGTGVEVDHNRIQVTIGDSRRIRILVKNGEATTEVFPLYLGSFDQSKNWAWFTGHRTDKNRRNLNITVRPKEQKVVTIDFFGAVVGNYKLIVGPDEDYANKYDEIDITVIHKKRGFFNVTPDISTAFIMLVAIIAAIIGGSCKRFSAIKT